MLDETQPENEEKTSAKQVLARKNVATFFSQPENAEIAFIRTDNKLYKYLQDDRRWSIQGLDAFKRSNSLLNDALAWNEFWRILEAGGCVFDEKTYSFQAQTTAVKNLMKTDHWLKPTFERTQLTRYFDYLLHSLCNGDPENIKHVQEVIGWKYLHPEAWALPALCFYGEGTSGKNLLASTVMRIIFGSDQVLVTNFKKIEKFDAALAGKTVVMFDEHPQREDQSALKAIIGQPTLTVEPKNIGIYTTDNTALYFIATNNPESPIKLEHNGTERRYSFIRSDIQLPDVIADGEGISVEEAIAKADEIEAAIFRNRSEVAIFLGECITAAKARTTRPVAHHGDDYDVAVMKQKDLIDDLFDDIFVDHWDFKYITRDTLYALYLMVQKKSNPGASPLSTKNFGARVERFLKTHPALRLSDRLNMKRQGSKERVKTSVFYHAEKFEGFTSASVEDDNAQFYLSGAYLTPDEQAQKLIKVSHAFKTQRKA